MQYPRAFSHIGITVPDLKKAVEFYEQTMGWYTIMKPTIIKEENDTAIGKMCIDVFGENWGNFKIAHLSTSDSIGIELFEFDNNLAVIVFRNSFFENTEYILKRFLF